jgi:transposase
MTQFSKFVGLDTHQDTIAVAVSDACGGKPRYYGEIPNKPEAIAKLVKALTAEGEAGSFCYEAGPCGYEIYRQLTGLGQTCAVVAPSLIPTKPGDRVKTDRRDCAALSRLHRAGELTPVWVPAQEQEARRDLTRAREDMKGLERTTKQRLNAFLLRYGRLYDRGKSRWTQAHFRWLEGLKFEGAVQQVGFQEYVDAVKQAEARVAGLEQEMAKAVKDWALAPMALRGGKLITAMTVLAELGDLSRFATPRQLMAYLGLVPSEHSSGQTRRRGGITKTGNGHVRRVLVEAAWCYRFPARKTVHLQRRAKQTSAAVQAIAWKAQKRLCGRYGHLLAVGKLKVQACTAVARELAGFIWAIACAVMNQPVVRTR